MGGAPKHPVWYYNLKQNPHVELQDCATKVKARAATVGDTTDVTCTFLGTDIKVPVPTPSVP